MTDESVPGFGYHKKVLVPVLVHNRYYTVSRCDISVLVPKEGEILPVERTKAQYKRPLGR